MVGQIKDGLFQLESSFQPQGDQPEAIEKLVAGIQRGRKHQVLLGVTGSGKTFTMANVIARFNGRRSSSPPTRPLRRSSTMSSRRCSRDNAARYFVSYYDYYQPEAYVPSSDTYIEKDASINDEIDKLRHSATKALLERRDVVIVASVSCIYGLGSPEAYFDMMVFVEQDR